MKTKGGTRAIPGVKNNQVGPKMKSPMLRPTPADKNFTKFYCSALPEKETQVNQSALVYLAQMTSWLQGK